jgi:hypothetical protein
MKFVTYEKTHISIHQQELAKQACQQKIKKRKNIYFNTNLILMLILIPILTFQKSTTSVL